MSLCPSVTPASSAGDVVRVALARDPGVPLARIAADFGIGKSSLQNWIREATQQAQASTSSTAPSDTLEAREHWDRRAAASVTKLRRPPARGLDAHDPRDRLGRALGHDHRSPDPGPRPRSARRKTESLPTQEAVRRADASGLPGPEARFRLVQQGVTTSRDYDLDHLAHLWHTFLAREDWITWRQSAPRKKVQWEKDGLARLAELGAIFDLSPTSTLTEIVDVINRCARIGSRMASDPRQPR